MGIHYHRSDSILFWLAHSIHIPVEQYLFRPMVEWCENLDWFSSPTCVTAFIVAANFGWQSGYGVYSPEWAPNATPLNFESMVKTVSIYKRIIFEFGKVDRAILRFKSLISDSSPVFPMVRFFVFELDVAALAGMKIPTIFFYEEIWNKTLFIEFQLTLNLLYSSLQANVSNYVSAWNSSSSIVISPKKLNIQSKSSHSSRCKLP